MMQDSSTGTSKTNRANLVLQKVVHIMKGNFGLSVKKLQYEALQDQVEYHESWFFFNESMYIYSLEWRNSQKIVLLNSTSWNDVEFSPFFQKQSGYSSSQCPDTNERNSKCKIQWDVVVILSWNDIGLGWQKQNQQL